MKKISILLLLVVPMLSFGQLTKKQKKGINAYTEDMCNCINDVLAELHPETLDFLLIMANEGEDAAMKHLDELMPTLSDADQKALYDSFLKMEDQAFLDKIEACDEKGDLLEAIKKDIDNMEGEAYEYFMKYLAETVECKYMKALYDMGTSTE